MFKRLLVSLILCIQVVTSCFAFNLVKDTSVKENAFDSIPMLEKYYDESDDGYLEQWDKYQISLLTVSQGGPIYSWFGHAALLVVTPDGLEYTFDYGNFSFEDEDFIKNFIMGRLWFVCSSSYARSQIASLQVDGRSVTKVDLPFTAAQKKAVINFLVANTQPENREYLYHHYKDNCATRLRDIIDRTTGGEFKKWAQTYDAPTFRQEASRALSRNRIVLWFLNFLQSATIDKSATLWDAMFLPSVLQDAVMTYFNLQSSLIIDNENSYKPIPDNPQSNIIFSILAGIVLSLPAALLLIFRHPRGKAIYIAIIDLFFGIIGSVLFFMMFFTNHDVTFQNENLIFINPLLIILGLLTFIPKTGPQKASAFCHGLLLAFILILALLKLLLPGIFSQSNWDILLTMFLIYLPASIPFATRSNS